MQAVFATRSYTYTRAHPRMPTRLRTHARAHRRSPPRTTARAAPMTRRAHLPAEAAPLGPERAAHTLTNEVTRAVFHAPMFALNADAE